MFCKKCGSKVNEGAAFCDNCGNSLKKSSPKNIVVLEKPTAVHTAGKKPPVVAVAAIAVAVVAVIALVVVLVLNNGSSQNEIKPNTISANTIPSGSKGSDSVVEENKVKIKLNVEMQDNWAFARYGVDVLINGTAIKTMMHGDKYSTEIEVEKGYFTVEFAKNYSTSEEKYNNDNVKSASITENIECDTTLSFYLQTHEKNIEIKDYSAKNGA